MDLVIVGGGQASLLMLEYFLYDEHVRVVAMVDLNDAAPGMQRARELGIRTCNDLRAAITASNVGAVLEITGNAKVRKLITELLRPDQDLMTAGSARLMSDVLARTTHRRDGQIADELKSLTQRMDDAMGNVDQAAVQIAKVLRAIRILALNGNIEAARAGAAGAAFAVVVEHMHELVEQVRTAVDNIGNSSEEGHSVLDALHQTRAQLRQGVHAAAEATTIST